MAKPRSELWAGIFLILGLAVLIFGITWLKQASFIRNTYPVKVVFQDTGGLRVGDPVDIAGVEKGKVARIELQPQNVLVILEVLNDVFLPQDSRITMRNRSLFTGEKYIKIELGSSSEPADPEVPFNGGYHDEFSITGITRTIQRLDSLLSQLDLTQLTQRIDEGIAQVVESSKESLGALKIEEGDYTSLIRNLELATANLDTVLTAVKDGKGTLGRLVLEDSIYKEILGASQELRSLILEIKAHPERYLHITIF
jgi:phospholipid/cholesterol/gamma-HCH transport system substrate-binding protein